VGVRTLAVGEGRYNPIGYHVGAIWPFDNSFIAWGLRRYGFKEEAAQVAAGILEAASSSTVGSPKRSAATHAR
jgi:glycogen debranching enzyme